MNMLSKKLLIVFFVPVVLFGCTAELKRIVCVGDSITEGADIVYQNKDAYPSILDDLLPENYDVLNCGRSGTALQKDGDFSYWRTKEFHNLFAFRPNIVVIKLGTNDTKPQNWNKQRFERDYQALIDTIKTMKTSPEIFMCLPVPVFETKWGINDSTLNEGVIPVIKSLAVKNNLQIIDLNSPMQNKENMFPDKIHPNVEGTTQMATIISTYILKKNKK